MSLCDEKLVTSINTSGEIENFNNSIELIRKCKQQDPINTSWDHSCYYGSDKEHKVNINKTPPFVSIMFTDDCSPSGGNVTSSSTQTEQFVTLPANCSIVDVSLSFSNDLNAQDSGSDNCEQFLGNKRLRRDSFQDNGELRPSKKTKCTESGTSSTSDLTDSDNISRKISLQKSPSLLLSSSSETSFKSINSNSSFKVRKRRLKSDSNLFRDALQRSRKITNPNKHSYSENSTPGLFQSHIFFRPST